MTGFTQTDATFFGTVLEALFYGAYCVIFALYTRLRFQKDAQEKKFLVYPLLTLFILCTIFFCLDVAEEYLYTLHGNPQTSIVIWNLNTITTGIYGFVDIISQCLLIYRCWIIWDKSKLTVAVPSFLAFTSFVLSTMVLVLLGRNRASLDFIPSLPSWFPAVLIAFYSISLGVNTLVTGLIILKLAHLHREASDVGGVQVPRIDILPIISMLLESGTPMFLTQLICVILLTVKNSNGAFVMFSTVITMVFGMTPTLIIVRVTMRENANRATMEMGGLSDIHFIFPSQAGAINTEKLDEATTSRKSSDGARSGTMVEDKVMTGSIANSV